MFIGYCISGLVCDGNWIEPSSSDEGCMAFLHGNFVIAMLDVSDVCHTMMMTVDVGEWGECGFIVCEIATITVHQ
jgi:hypothetical protein